MNKNKEIIIPLAVMALLILGVIFLAIFPLNKEIKKNFEELRELKNDLALLDVKTENIKEVKQDYQNFQANLGELNKLFIDFDAPLEFINFLEKNAKDLGLSVKISSVSSKEAKADPWPSLSFQMDLQGSSSVLLKYIQKLENSPYLIEITNLSIKRLEEQEEIGASLSIKTFAK